MAIPKEIEKKYFSITEVAQMLQLTPVTLRHWETELPSLKPKKTPKGDRQYSRQDIEHLRLIYELIREKGFTLAGARDFIKKRQHLSPEKTELIAGLQNLKNFLLQIRDSL
jgi:DNA-binding transcriptional MerR regulator